MVGQWVQIIVFLGLGWFHKSLEQCLSLQLNYFYFLFCYIYLLKVHHCKAFDKVGAMSAAAPLNSVEMMHDIFVTFA